MPESRTLGKRVRLHSAVFRKLVLQPLGLCLTLRAKWLWSAKGRLVGDALDDSRSFYLHYEFISLLDHPNRLSLAMATIEKAYLPK